MTPHKQRFRHDPANGVYGDCWRTVIACLLDIEPEEIPHEHRPYENNEQTVIVREFLARRGLGLFGIAYEQDPDEILRIIGGGNPGLYYMLSGLSRTGCNHVVICRGAEIVHDTSLNDAGIVGRQDNGQTLVEFLVWL